MTEKDLYLFGLYLSDGWKGNTSSISFEMKDRQIISDIANLENRVVRVRDKEVNGTVCTEYTVSLSAEKSRFIASFEEGHKGFDFFFDSLLAEEQDIFVRGYFDGDGSVNLTKTGRARVQFYCSNDSEKRIIKKWLEDRKIPYLFYEDSRGSVPVYDYHVGVLFDVFRLYNLMYRTCSICLQRKKALFEEGLKSLQLIVSEHLETGELQYWKSVPEAAKAFGVKRWLVDYSLHEKEGYKTLNGYRFFYSSCERFMVSPSK